ncbi:hypothetical protein [Pseudoxanthomonas winnipegensis]|uniref:Uncharacterized protein n=1 Tax=Pseudoxanthomonas winnipegensis TaxID=2480810 RepID=A0A4Q8M489_9GAMM|nr:hypothetical protein [Pseudoxanthomonas winnipegensis]TAA41570.1 hypothetical protein EA655_11560 [Pseudoxanthomonas winnipegensis]
MSKEQGMLLQNFLDENKQHSVRFSIQITGNIPGERFNLPILAENMQRAFYSAAEVTPELHTRHKNDVVRVSMVASINAYRAVMQVLLHQDMSVLQFFAEPSEDPYDDLSKQFSLACLVGRFEFAHRLSRVSNSDFWSHFDGPSLFDPIFFRFHICHMWVHHGAAFLEDVEYKARDRMMAMDIDRSKDYGEEDIQKTAEILFGVAEFIRGQLSSGRIDDLLKSVFSTMVSVENFDADDLSDYLSLGTGGYGNSKTMLQLRLEEIGVLN